MLQMLNSTVAMILALGLLLVLLFGPLAAFWCMLSMRRSLARIADALEAIQPRELPLLPERHADPLKPLDDPKRNIANSMFGR